MHFYYSYLIMRIGGENALADRIMQAVLAVCAEGRLTTADLGGTASTKEYTAEVVRRVNEEGALASI